MCGWGGIRIGFLWKVHSRAGLHTWNSNSGHRSDQVLFLRETVTTILPLLLKENLRTSKSIESPNAYFPIISEVHIKFLSCGPCSLFLKFSVCYLWCFEIEISFTSCNNYYAVQATDFLKIFYDCIFTNAAPQCVTAFIYSFKMR